MMRPRQTLSSLLPSPLLRSRPTTHLIRRQSTTAPPSPTSTRRLFTYSALLTGGLLTGFSLALVLPRPQLLSLIFPLPTPIPHHADSPLGLAEKAQLENELQQLPLVQRLRAERIPAPPTSPSSTSETSLTAPEGTTTSSTIPRYFESRPYAATKPGPHSLSGYALRGPGKFILPPLVFTDQSQESTRESAVFIMHLGSGLCGHEGVVHGGLLATVLDESLGRTALRNLPSNIGVTATLKLAYKKPTFANQFVVIKTELKEVKGRKVVVAGRVESLEGETLVEAEALFVEPKMAKFLNSSSVREALK